MLINTTKVKNTLCGIVLACAIILGSADASDKTLRLGLASLPPGLGNPFASTARTSWYTWRAIFDTLTVLGPDMTTKPALAVSWDSIDKYTWMVELRDGVTFSNGEPLTAEAVISTFSYLQSQKAGQEPLSREVQNIVAMRAIGDRTIKFITKQPNPNFPAQLTVVPIVPPKYWQEVGRDRFALLPVGTGPFAVTEWQETGVSFVASAGSWHKPVLDHLEILALPETSSRVQALLSGQVDIASEIGPDDVEILRAAGHKIYQRPPTSIGVIAFNQSIESPFKDRRVRQALNYAVNKDAIGKTILAGMVKPASQMTPHDNPYANPDLAPYPYDPDLAKALLREAGYPKGFSFVYEFSMGTGGAHQAAIYQQVASDLAKVGVTMDIKPFPWPQLLRGILQGEWRSHAFGFEYETLPTGETLRPFRLHSCTWAHPWYCDEMIQPVIEQAKHMFIESERRALIRLILSRYHEEAAALLLFEQLGLDAYTPTVTGYSQVNGLIPFATLDVGG